MWRLTRKIPGVFYHAGYRLIYNDGIEFAGYLTFLSLLALFPFLVLIVAAAGFIGQGQAGDEFIRLILTGLPQEAVTAIRPRIQEIVSGPPQGLLTISILGAIWTSSSAVEGMRTVLNRAYQVSNPPTYIWRRFMSILQLILFTFVIIIIMLAIVVTPLWLGSFTPQTGTPMLPPLLSVWQHYVVYFSISLLFIAVASLYFFLPNLRQTLFSIAPGAALVVCLWLGGAKFFSFYFANVEQVSVIYGSLGGFIATMVFFFLMNLIFIYGAEFNHALALAYGHEPQEKEHTEGLEELHFTKPLHAPRDQEPPKGDGNG